MYWKISAVIGRKALYVKYGKHVCVRFYNVVVSISVVENREIAMIGVSWFSFKNDVTQHVIYSHLHD